MYISSFNNLKRRVLSVLFTLYFKIRIFYIIHENETIRRSKKFNLKTIETLGPITSESQIYQISST